MSKTPDTDSGSADLLQRRIALAGRRPCDPEDIAKALDYLVQAEEGTVTSFIMIGAGAHFATFDLQTAMTRQDRLTLMGELQQQLHVLALTEQNQRDQGK